MADGSDYGGNPRFSNGFVGNPGFYRICWKSLIFIGFVGIPDFYRIFLESSIFRGFVGILYFYRIFGNPRFLEDL